MGREEFGFQYSPYVYYNEHCIVFNQKHVPMKIDRSTFVKLFDFVKAVPPLFPGLQCRPSHRRRFHSVPRSFPGRLL